MLALLKQNFLQIKNFLQKVEVSRKIAAENPILVQFLIKNYEIEPQFYV